MKISVKFVVVFIVLELFGTTYCAPPEHVPGCPLPPETGDQSRLRTLRDDIMPCVFATNGINIKAVMQQANGDGEIQDGAKNYCSLGSLAQQCVYSVVNDVGEKCLNSTDLHILNLSADFYFKLHIIMCKNESRHLVDIVKALKKTYADGKSANYVVEICTARATEPFGKGTASRYDPVMFNSSLYKTVKEMQICAREHSDEYAELGAALDPFLQEWRGTLTCIDINANTIPCEEPADESKPRESNAGNES